PAAHDLLQAAREDCRARAAARLDDLRAGEYRRAAGRAEHILQTARDPRTKVQVERADRFGATALDRGAARRGGQRHRPKTLLSAAVDPGADRGAACENILRAAIID